MRIKELDGLRGIAVLAVISEHYLSWLPTRYARYGWLGVDLFFVLSGFLITSILLSLRNQQHYFSVFYARRALRIFPPYFLAILIYLCVSLAVGKHGDVGLWLQYVFYYTSLFVGQPAQLHSSPLIIPLGVAFGLAVLWSLSVEEIYYTVWAPVVRYTNDAALAFILVSMMVIAPILRWKFHTPDFPELYTFYCRMDALGYGSAVALFQHLRRHKQNAVPGKQRLAGWLTAAFVVFTLLFWVITGGDRGNVQVSTLGLTAADISFALLVYTLVRHAGSSQIWVRAFRASWLRSIGMVSYSLYLFHYPLRIVSEDLVRHLHLPRRIDAVGSAGLGVVLSLAVAYGLWYGLESHILRWKDNPVPSSREETVEADVIAS
jgi:peptidoglycan/LPS O-acetylase OafA/YrhL